VVESETKEGQPVLSLVPIDRSVSIEESDAAHVRHLIRLYRRRTDQAGLFTSPPTGRGMSTTRFLADRITGLPLARQPGTLWR